MILFDGNPGEIIEIKPKEYTSLVEYPIPIFGSIKKTTPRINRRVSFSQFFINVANARTVHKLQGRSIENLVISNWNYTGNWIYVVLSRCTTRAGLFLRMELNKAKLKGMSDEVKDFIQHFRTTKQPTVIEENGYERPH